MTSLFGEYGIHGNIDSTLDVHTAFKLGMAIGEYLDGTVAMTTDGRPTSEMIFSAVSSGLMAVGCDIIVVDTVPSEALQYRIGKRADIEGGIVIADPNDNGDMYLKCIFGDGLEIAEGAMDKIRATFEEDDGSVYTEGVGKIINDSDPIPQYVSAVLGLFPIKDIRNSNMTVVLDCCNCIPSKILVPILTEAVNVPIVLNSTPGKNIPFSERVNDVKTLIKSNKAAVGVIADSNRMYFLTDKGILLDEDQTFALLAKGVLAKSPTSVVKTHFSSDLITETVEKNGGKIVLSTVGLISIIDSMKEYKCRLGGEDGRYIFPDNQYCYDLGMTMMQMLDCIVRFGKLSNQVKEFGPHYKYRMDVDCPENYKAPALEMIREAHTLTLREDKDGPHIAYNDCTVHILPRSIVGKIVVIAESNDPDICRLRVMSVADEFTRFVNS